MITIKNQKLLAIIALLYMLITPLLAKAQGYSVPPEFRPTYAPGTYIEDAEREGEDTGGLTAYSVEDFWFAIGDIAKVLLSVTGMVTVFFILQAGFNYVMSGGRQEKLDEAKNTLKWAILGFATVLFSYSVVDFMVNFLISISGTKPPS